MNAGAMTFAVPTADYYPSRSGLPAQLLQHLLDIAQFLLDEELYIHRSRLNYKPEFRGKEFYRHSDFETWRVEDGMPRMRALSMSITHTENSQ
jgi:ectoine hydroxylase